MNPFSVPTWLRRRRQRNSRVDKRAGFVGYSRSNAGSYHDRMIAHRSRAQLFGIALVALVLTAVFICMLMLTTWL